LFRSIGCLFKLLFHARHEFLKPFHGSGLSGILVCAYDFHFAQTFFPDIDDKTAQGRYARAVEKFQFPDVQADEGGGLLPGSR